MKKIGKLISSFLSIAIVLTMLTVTPILADDSPCYIGSVGYSTLQEAVYAAETGDTIVITADLTVSSRINLSSNNSNATQVTITDDGKPHTITVANKSTTSGGGYGRGFQVQDKKTIDIVATDEGNLTFDGTGNAGVGFLIYAGAINLTNVTLKNFTNSITASYKTGLGGALSVGYSGSTSSATSTLTNVTFENNSANSVGKDIYVNDGKSITFNGTNEASDMYVGTSSSIKLLSGYDSASSIGLNFGTLTNGLSVVSGAGLSKKSVKTFTVGNDSSYYINNNGVLTNDGITFGEKSTDGLSYTFPDVSTSFNEGAKAVALQVDNGSFAIDFSKLSGISKVYGLDESNNYISTQGDTKLTAATVVFDSNINSDEVATFIKTITFYPGRNNYPQKVSVAVADSLSEDAYFGIDGTYEYNDDALTFKMTEFDASSNDKFIASVSNLADSTLIPKVLTSGGFISLVQEGSRWQWKGTSLNGTIVSANATTNEGYDGSFANWADGEPKADNTNAYINEDGQWTSCSSYYTGTGYYSLVESPKVFEASTSVKVVENSVLSSMKLSFDGDISMYYYFDFDSDTLADTTNKVVVTVGDNEIVTESTIAEMSEFTDDAGNYGIKVSLPAKMMNANVRLDLETSSGNILRSYGNVNGNNSSKNYNPLHYANYVLNVAKTSSTNFSSDLISMIKAMLNYGAATQEQFNYNTEKLVNEGYEDTSATTTASSITKDIYVASGSGVTWKSASLAANSLTCMRFTFAPNLTAANITATVDGDEVEVKNDGSNYYVDIPVAANNIFKEYVISVNVGSDTAILTINEAYVLKQLLSQSTDKSALKTADMLYKFGKTANTYIGEYSQNTIAQEAVLNTVYAYLKKGAYTQYDMKSIAQVNSSAVGNTPQSRREILINLEDLDILQSGYVDCSSFIFNTYRSAYNYNDVVNAFLDSSVASISSFRTKYFNSNPNPSSVIYSISNMASSNWYEESDEVQATYYANWKKACEEVKKILQPGDVVTYYGYNISGTAGGHILMWVGNGFIHSTGNSYDTDNVKDYIENAGSVGFKSADDFNASYIQKHGAMTMVVLRPSLSLKSSSLSSYADARTQLGTLSVSALTYDETLDKYIYNGQAVNNGDTMKYTISLDNTDIKTMSASTKELNVSYTVPDGLEIVSADSGAVIDGGAINWNNLSVLAGENRMLTITLKVTGTTGTKIGSGNGEVTLANIGDSASPLSISFQQTEVEDVVSEEQIASIQNLVNTYSTYSSSGTAPFDVLKNVLKDVGIPTTEIDDYSSDSELFNSIFTTRVYSGSNIFEVKNASYWDKNLASNLVGGTFLVCRSAGGDFSAQNRQKALTANNLQIGDIIQTYRRTNNYYDYYIYLGNNQVMAISNKGVTSITDFSVTSTSTTYTYETGIPAIVQQRSTYAVIRLLGR